MQVEVMNSIKNVRERMAAGTPVFGTFMANVKDSALVVAMAHCGLDFVILDIEHGMFDGEDVTRIISEAKRAEVCAVVRVPPNDPALFAQVLDAGAEGILAPQVRTMEQVNEIVRLTKYPTNGYARCSFHDAARQF
jgi:2-keto-3-deoxy-L-rhamnonate aldolase RhmA